jgi:hypothetical protein
MIPDQFMRQFSGACTCVQTAVFQEKAPGGHSLHSSPLPHPSLFSVRSHARALDTTNLARLRCSLREAVIAASLAPTRTSCMKSPVGRALVFHQLVFTQCKADRNPWLIVVLHRSDPVLPAKSSAHHLLNNRRQFGTLVGLPDEQRVG